MAKDQVLDREILRLSENDVIRFRDIIEGGCFVSGGLGGEIFNDFISPGDVGHVRGFGNARADGEVRRNRAFHPLCQSGGRGDDLIIFNAHSGLSFDPLAFIWKTGGRAAALIEGIVKSSPF